MGWLCFGLKRRRDWKASYANTYISGEGNIITLGGRTEPLKMVLCPMNQKETKKQKPEALLFSYMNTTLLNVIKSYFGILAGVSYLHAYTELVGPCLVRCFNLVQHYGYSEYYPSDYLRRRIPKVLVLTGGSWINWSRISDSLMYTGLLSVVLLEGFTRNVVLGHILGITVDKAPLLVFSIIALANGLYFLRNNIFRGFPQNRCRRNLFRSILPFR